MPECAYCGESFEDEDAHLKHLRDEHKDELGSIDRRRVADLDGDGDRNLPTGPLVLGGVIVLAVIVVAYVILFAGGGGGEGPGSFGSAHEHGTIEMIVLGEQVDFSNEQYQLAADRFHFEGGNGDVWHAHATGVTLQWGMNTLPGIELTADSVTYEGTTYRDGDGYEIEITVNGEPVNPETYVLDGVENPPYDRGDNVRIVVRES
ncbi:MAG: hypothetical protein ABEH64_13595 [Salinirussus sp.]